MFCPNCEGKGFKEYEHGLIVIRCKTCKGKGEIEDVIDSGVGGDNNYTGDTDSGKPPEHQKQGAPKKARKRTRQVF